MPDDLPDSKQFPQSGAPPVRTTGGSTLWTPPSPEHLQRLLPQYEIISILGRGGMGAVYKGRQISLDRLVAIKLLPREALEDNEEANFTERFKNEARSMAKMNHPAIVSVYDFGETSEGQLYIVMEYVDATDVAKMITEQKKLAPEHALAITAHVCDALDYAHSHGVIHRDIKPANVLMSMAGNVKIADFGLAKATDSGATAITKTNMTMGTPDFIAPEALISGELVDHRADLYAVGVMLYNMLTGKVPRGVFLPASQLAGTDPRYDAIVSKAMQTECSYRYQTAMELRRDLDVILTVPMVKEQPAPQQQPPRSVAQKPVARGPQPRNDGTPAVVKNVNETDGRSAVVPKKPTIALFVGIGAAVVIAVGAFFAFKKPLPTGSTSTPQVSSKAVDEAFMREVANAATREQQVALVAAKLNALNNGGAGVEAIEERGKFKGLKITRTKEATNVSDITPVAAIKDMERLTLYYLAVEDISCLRGMKLTHITVHGSSFEDISVLRDMPLIHFEMRGGPPRDYSALRSKALERLDISVSPASDISFIKGMPWTYLNVSRTKVKDLSPIAGLPLKELNCDFVPSRDTEILKSVTTLIRINEEPATEFWKKHWGASPPQNTPLPSRIVTAPVTANDVPKTEPTASGPPVVNPRPAPTVTSTMPPATVATPASSDPRLAQLEAGFKVRYETDAQKPFLTTLAALNQSYTANGIGAARTAAQKKGALDEVTALDAEKTRVESNEPLPAADLDSLPASLKQLRGTYRTALAKIEADRAKKAAPLFDLYLGALDVYIGELTKGNKITEAQKVKTLRYDIAAQKAAIMEGGAAPAPSAAPVRNTSTSSTAGAPSSKANLGPPLPIPPEALEPPKKAEHTRELLEWALLKCNGRARTAQGNQVRDFAPANTGVRVKPEDLPKAGFNLVILDSANTVREPLDTNWIEGETNLQDLQLWQVDFSSPLALRGMKKLANLKIRGSKALTDEQMRFWPPLPALTGADLESAFGNEGLRALCERCPQLTRLTLLGCRLTEGGLLTLQHLKNLTYYHMDGGRVPKSELSVLASLPKLDSLTLGQMDLSGADFSAFTNLVDFWASPANLGDTEVKTLGKLKKLTKLRLMGNQITDDALPALGSLTKLQFLDLSTNKAISDVGLQALCNGLHKLEGLRLNGTRVTDAGIPALKQLKAVESLQLADTGITDASVEHLSKLGTLTDLLVKNTKITAEGIATLKKALPQCKVTN